MGAANTNTDTTRPIMHARRPNSVSSPPHNIVPPAIAIPMRPTAYATGPVSDVAIVCIGRSHGRFPTAAAWSRTLKAHAQVNRVASLMTRLDWFRLLIRCISRSLLEIRLLAFLNVLDRIFPIGVPGYEQNLPDFAAGCELRLFIHEDDNVNRLRDERLLGCAGF